MRPLIVSSKEFRVTFLYGLGQSWCLVDAGGLVTVEQNELGDDVASGLLIVVLLVDEVEAMEGVGDTTFFVDFGGYKKALILRNDDIVETRSYSSMRLTKSSSHVIDISASRSSLSSWWVS